MLGRSLRLAKMGGSDLQSSIWLNKGDIARDKDMIGTERKRSDTL